MQWLLSILCLTVTTGNPNASNCSNAGWIGDGYCDDVTNNIQCNYDGGDCCGVNINTQYCVQCQCLDGNTTTTSGGPTTTGALTTSSTLFGGIIIDMYSRIAIFIGTHVRQSHSYVKV